MTSTSTRAVGSTSTPTASMDDAVWLETRLRQRTAALDRVVERAETAEAQVTRLEDQLRRARAAWAAGRDEYGNNPPHTVPLGAHSLVTNHLRARAETAEARLREVTGLVERHASELSANVLLSPPDPHDEVRRCAFELAARAQRLLEQVRDAQSAAEPDGQPG